MENEIDCQQIVAAAKKHNYEISLTDAEAIWAAYSQSLSATWHVLPAEDLDRTHHWEAILPMLELITEFGYTKEPRIFKLSEKKNPATFTVSIASPPEGWKLVPRKLTPEMDNAATEADITADYFEGAWEAAWDAAPELDTGERLMEANGDESGVWQSIETAPKCVRSGQTPGDNGKRPVLVCRWPVTGKHYPVVVARLTKNGWMTGKRYNHLWFVPTHWMPLPGPPDA